MSDDFIFILTLVSALGSGLIAGVFFAFSTFIMKALFRLPSKVGIAAMQSINLTVLNRWFFSVFFGTAITCLLLVLMSVSHWSEPGASNRLIGSSLYLIGTILVTIIFNVPRNDVLAAVDPARADVNSVWANYVTQWTAWNHVRTVAAFAGAALLTMAAAGM